MTTISGYGGRTVLCLCISELQCQELVPNQVGTVEERRGKASDSVAGRGIKLGEEKNKGHVPVCCAPIKSIWWSGHQIDFIG